MISIDHILGVRDGYHAITAVGHQLHHGFTFQPNDPITPFRFVHVPAPPSNRANP